MGTDISNWLMSNTCNHSPNNEDVATSLAVTGGSAQSRAGQVTICTNHMDVAIALAGHPSTVVAPTGNGDQWSNNRNVSIGTGQRGWRGWCGCG